jgi:4-amino-4-deoxy-L-arabinose transferase-like glycosyltransferase
MAVRERRVLVAERGGSLLRAVAHRPNAAGLRAAIALALLAGALYAVGLDRPAFFDNEGRYAEVAREMIESGDYVTPHLDYAVFLNKPPLVAWLTSLVFHVTGPSEWGRLVPLLAAVVTLFATCRLGALLYGETTGLAAGIALATMLGFVLEARTLRPDLPMTATVVAALLCWMHVRHGDGRRWLLGLYAALGVGMLAKGFVPVVLAGLPIVIVTLREGGWRGVLRLRPGLGLLVFAAIVLPWHVAAALANPGFAWDYVVNQHVLFFLAKKFPRDSVGDSLGFFWAAAAGRMLPWSLIAPLTVSEAMRGFARDATRYERGTFVVWAWAGSLMLFFSAAPSRLEHYAVPALPAIALLAGRVWQRARRGELRPAAWTSFAAASLVLAAAGGVLVVAGRPLLSETYWIAQVPTLVGFALPAGLVVAVTGIVAAVGAVRRRPALLFGAFATGIVPLSVVVLRAEIAAEPLFSWRPVAHVLAAAPADTEIVFEAPEEYQLVGALAFYTGRHVTLVRPAGFVPPTYLEPHAERMFISRAEFERRWSSRRRVAIVSDPLRRREQAEGLAPEPFVVLGRFGDRWVLANPAAAAAH